ncbi:MAG: monovalent cation/H(+) antiporter subunit G [Rhodospirillaceae bacterium]|nr:monovalent cation/H(+) antiporter subunit G [Rhodospirillaceae bacterium]
MNSFIEIASWALIVAGVFFAITGTIGLVRLPDVFTRMHGAGMVDTMGIGLILIGLMLHAPSIIVAIKLFLILAFIFFTSPTTCYALARATIHAGVKPSLNTDTKKTGTKKTEKKSSKT